MLVGQFTKRPRTMPRFIFLCKDPEILRDMLADIFDFVTFFVAARERYSWTLHRRALPEGRKRVERRHPTSDPQRAVHPADVLPHQGPRAGLPVRGQSPGQEQVRLEPTVGQVPLHNPRNRSDPCLFPNHILSEHSLCLFLALKYVLSCLNVF